ncbi:MAG: UbiA prenyltransferase family protein [Bacteroidia bacterium]|jgi:4-hydroxybenzoate polyprenyltransferase|nr:UbiA prenyltransferase family protein [Bacteroidia bacterium]GIV22514.1 MAG: decaprenyl-phosphate phosphoribosyltransferase [Bacteroidia bacterium]
MGRILKAWLSLLRPYQYTKNFLLFAPVVFSKRWDLLDEAFWAFLLWCLGSSAIYALNDAKDAPQDRLHPVKKNRPVAAGLISPLQAYTGAAALALMAIGGALWLKSLFALLLGLYMTNNLLYTFWLKRFALWDVFSIAAGFLLRIYGGAALGNIPISAYLFMTVFFLSLFLALGKRRHELLLLSPEQAGQSRRSLGGYSVYYLDQLMGISATLTVTVYMLYLMHAPFRWLLMSLPVVVMGIFRYYHLTHNKGAGEPSRDLFADPLLLGLGAAYGILALLEMLEVPFPKL